MLALYALLEKVTKHSNKLDMKNLRERLIDFASELQKIGFNEYDSIEQTVDIYLKSINQHTGEARTLEENEAQKELSLWMCPSCHFQVASRQKPSKCTVCGYESD